MPDFSSVSAGQTENLPIYSAGWINSVSRVTSQLEGQGTPLRGNRPERGINPTMVKIQNLTGLDLLRGHVVQLGAAIIDELDPAKIWFQGNKPADPVDRWLAIVRKATKHGDDEDIVDAQMIGVTTAIVNVSSTSHGYAKAAADSRVLISADSGPIEILSEISETGEQEVAVLIGSGGSATGVRAMIVTNVPAASEFDGTVGSGVLGYAEDAAIPLTISYDSDEEEYVYGPTSTTLVEEVEVPDKISCLNHSMSPIEASATNPKVLLGNIINVQVDDTLLRMFEVTHVELAALTGHYADPGSTKLKIPYSVGTDDDYKLNSGPCDVSIE